MAIAEIIASASKCKRKKVGSVLVTKDKRIIGTGYNGPAAGAENNCECQNTTTEFTIHAEINCILNATRENISGSTLYLTLSPCKRCAAVILQKKITRVVYKSQYRDTAGIQYLQKHGVNTHHL